MNSAELPSGLHINNNIISLSQHSHPVGSYYLSPDKKYGYINIPKNASTSMKSMLVGWTLESWHNIQPTETYVAIMRDPLSRWISGISEFLSRTPHDLVTTEYSFDDQWLAMHLLLSKLVFDEHTLPQVWFLQGIDISKCKFFHLSNSVTEEIAEYVGIEHTNYQHNVAITRGTRADLVAFLKTMVADNSNYREAIIRGYQVDYDLLDKITNLGE